MDRNECAVGMDIFDPTEVKMESDLQLNRIFMPSPHEIPADNTVPFVSSSDGTAERLGEELARRCQALKLAGVSHGKPAATLRLETDGTCFHGAPVSSLPVTLSSEPPTIPPVRSRSVNLPIQHGSMEYKSCATSTPSQDPQAPLHNFGGSSVVQPVGSLNEEESFFAQLMSDDFCPPAGPDILAEQFAQSVTVDVRPDQSPTGQIKTPAQRTEKPKAKPLPPSDGGPKGNNRGQTRKLKSKPPADTEAYDPFERQRIAECFGMPIQLAAKKLGLGVTVLKRKCRQYGIPRWPYRKIKSIDNLIHSVTTLENHEDQEFMDSIRQTKLNLHTELQCMYYDPGTDMKLETKKLRQSNFKHEYKLRQEEHRLRSVRGRSQARDRDLIRSTIIQRASSPDSCDDVVYL